MKILTIDAWRDIEPKSWYWNNYFHVGDISKEEFEKLDSDKKIANWFFTAGYTRYSDLRRIEIEDDGYNVILRVRKTGEPVFAIEYGPEYIEEYIEAIRTK